MLERRTFRIVVVRPDRGAGIGETEAPDRTVTYSGDELAIEMLGRRDDAKRF